MDSVAHGFPTSWGVDGEPGTRSVCGADDSREAKCYQSSDPALYNESRAVARLLINGSSLCTGWLVGSEGHLMTNNHCIDSSSDALNTNYEFDAEGASCATNCASSLGCPGTVEATSATFVQTDGPLDFTLVQLPTNVTGTYGFMQLRGSGAVLGERIYIPQHPSGWGKRLGVESSHPQNPSGFCEVDNLSEPGCSGSTPDVGYYCDTRGGSSGSPVLATSDNCVVALHHCRGNAACTSTGGDDNRGVPIGAIISDLGGNLPANALCSAGNTAPTVTINAPSNGATFTEGDSVSFSGTASDAEDGSLTGSITWSSSIDGSIGSGGSFSTSSLSVGNHTITASVTDSGGLNDSDQISITVNSQGGGACTGCIDWTVTGTVSYSNQDASGNVTVQDAGATLFLQQNTWRRTTQTFTVTADTVIEFEFQSTSQGEIHGIGLDEDNSLSSNRIFKVHGTQNWGITDFDNYSGSGFTTYQIPVGQYYTGSSMFLVLVNDKDSGALTNNSSFRNVRIFEDTGGGGTCAVDDDFDTGAANWTTSGTCTTGTFIQGTPTLVTNSGVTTQVGGDHTSGSGNALFTAANTSAGVNDVDGGTCFVESPTWSVGGASTLSIWYFHGQRDTGDDPGDDFFNLEVSTNGGSTYTSLVSIGDVQTNAAWTEATTQIPAGADVRVRVSAADGAGPGDLVEGGIDDISICENN